jgi:DNA polymerase III alpha subunit
MLGNVEKMSLFLKEIEHKTTTKQMDMFSLEGASPDHSGLILETCEPMTFENRIKEEKSVIGMSISGNPLDGLGRYIIKKSIGLNYVKEFLDELNAIDTEDPMMAEEI